jgi:hypothetical protein
MNIETSTINALLVLVVGLQAYIIREQFKLKTRVALIMQKLNITALEDIEI